MNLLIFSLTVKHDNVLTILGLHLKYSTVQYTTVVGGFPLRDLGCKAWFLVAPQNPVSEMSCDVLIGQSVGDVGSTRSHWTSWTSS